MKQHEKQLVTGVTLLVVSGLNVYLPSVGNMFDTWRVWFSFFAFLVGFGFLIMGLIENTLES